MFQLAAVRLKFAPIGVRSAMFSWPLLSPSIALRLLVNGKSAGATL